MEDVLSDLAWVRDSRLAFHATGVAPVWFWRTDAAHILWANATGAACFGAHGAAALAARRFPPDHPAAVQIRRLSSTLYPGGAQRLERLRGLAPRIGKTTLCACSRLVVESTPGFLIVAQEPAAPATPLAARVQFLVSDCTAPIAAFAPDGTLLAATPTMKARIERRTGLAEIGAGEYAFVALAEGHAAGETSLGRMRFVRIGHDDSAVVLASFVLAPQSVAIGAHALATSDRTVAESHQALPPKALDAGRAADAPVAFPDPATDADAAFTPTPAAPPDRPAELASTPAPEPSPLRIDLPLPDTRYPMRFVWQADPEGRFTLCSNEFAEAIGPRTAVALGRPWKDIAAELGLDPDEQVLRAIASRDTWSGITVSFPVDDSDQRISVEMSGLPVYDRNRTFLGYRGFGVCRDVGALADFARMRRTQALAADPALPAQARHGASEPVSAARELASADTAELLIWSERAQEPLGPSPENVVRFPALPASESAQSAFAPPASKSAALNPGDHNVFHEIARQLQVRLAGPPDPAMEEMGPESMNLPGRPDCSNRTAVRAPGAAEPRPTAAANPRPDASELVAFLDRLPVGFLVYRYDQPLYANPAFLAATGHARIESFVAAGGLDSLFVDTGLGASASLEGGGRALTILSPDGEKTPVSARLFCLPWNGEAAFGLMLVKTEERNRSVDLSAKRAESHIRELRTILDIAFDGVVVIAPDGRIAYANRNAEALFGYGPDRLMGESFGDLFAIAGRAAALARLDRLRRGELRPPDDEETIGRTREGREFPLVMTTAAMPGGDRICVVFRNLASRRRPDGERAAIEQASERNAAVSERLSKLSHDVRTPLNSVLGFADLILDERFGPLGNERYRGYVRDIRSAAQHIATLHDIANAESGTLELAFGPVDLNEIVQSCVRAMQAEASRERIIIRMSLSQRRVTVVADAVSLRQIILNLLSNAIKLAGAGGQAIVSTGANDHGQVVLRVRDTGSGMNMTMQESAPSSEGATSKAAKLVSPSNLPLTKALAEANRGTFNVTSKANDGTLVEITFPGARLAAE
jgi:PAS domain S-box-containing protein